MMMIRKARLDDFDRLYQLNTKKLGYNYPVSQAKANLSALLADDEHQQILVAVDESNHEVCGYIHAELYQSMYAAPHV